MIQLKAFPKLNLHVLLVLSLLATIKFIVTAYTVRKTTTRSEGQFFLLKHDCLSLSLQESRRDRITFPRNRRRRWSNNPAGALTLSLYRDDDEEPDSFSHGDQSEKGKLYNNETIINEGQELASKFYKELQQRSTISSSIFNSRESPLKDIEDSLASAVEKSTPQAPQKFIGRKNLQQPLSPSSTLFTEGRDRPMQQPQVFQRSNSLFASNNNYDDLNNNNNNNNNNQKAAIQREREQEFNLASRFEQTIFVQAAVVLVSLIFVLYIGLTGGITNGYDRNYGGDDDQFEYDSYFESRRDNIEIIFDKSLSTKKDDSVWL